MKFRICYRGNDSMDYIDSDGKNLYKTYFV
jgi:hypothetical protein